MGAQVESGQAGVEMGAGLRGLGKPRRVGAMAGALAGPRELWSPATRGPAGAEGLHGAEL